jgi:hypothetical protein
MTATEPLLDALDQLVEAQTVVLDALRNVRDAAAGLGDTDPPPTGELTPPAGFTCTFDNVTRRATCRWTPTDDVVEIHEDQTDPANTLKATMPPGAAVRVSSELAGGHPYRFGGRTVRDGEHSEFVWVTIDVPARGDEPGGEPGGEPGEEPPPAPGGRTPVQVIPELSTHTVMLPIMKPDGDTPQNDYAGDWGNVEGVFYAALVGGAPAVVFRTPADGAHSKGSKYARTEARQMRDTAWTKGAWPSSGSHSLACDLAIDTSHLSTRKRISAMQIHDGGDDVCQLVYDADQGLGLAHNDGDSWEPIDPDYRDGDRFTCTIAAVGDVISVYYDGARMLDIPKRGTGWYFKWGCYLQTGGASTHVEPAGAYGEVVFWSAVTTGGAS